MKWWRAPFKTAEGETYSNVYRLVNNILEAGFNLGRFTKLRGAGGTGLQAGDFIIEVEDSYSDSLMDDLGEEYGVKLKPLKIVDLQSVTWIRQPLIGIYSGRGAATSYVQETAEVLENMGFRKISLLTGPLTPGDLGGLDVLIFGGGDSFEILRSLDPDETRLVRQFIETGGVYIGICAGAMLPLKPVNLLGAAYGELEAWSELQLVECEVLSDKVSEPSWPVFLSRRVGGVLRTYPVKGIVKSRIVKRGLLTLGYRGEIPMLHMGPLVKTVSPKNVFGRITSPSSSVEYGLPCEKTREIVEGASSIVFKEHGAGKIVLFFSHVESRETPLTHGLLGNALLLGTYSSEERRMLQQAETFEPEELKGAAESCRVMRLIRDSIGKVMDQIDDITPGLYANQLPDKAAQLSSLKQALSKMMLGENIIIKTIGEFVEADRVLQELKRKRPVLPQTTALSNSLAEYGYVVSKARKALPPILERIMKIQELMVDLSTTMVSSTKEEVEKQFDILWSIIAGGKANLSRGAPASPGVVSPLLSIILNFKDSFEKMRTLRKIVAYIQA
ncbi:MAG: BPL-N domain-containing protein [Thermoproteota archaeon]